MDPILIPLTSIIMGISLGIIAVVGKIYVRPWIEFKREQLKLQSEMAAEKTAQYAAKTDYLEKRVQVLERLVTDKASSLANEIEDLRDKPLN